MKVSSAPFESPLGSAVQRHGSEDSARAQVDKPSLHLVAAPSPNSSVKSGLDAVTKDALSRLAILVKEKEQEKEREKENSKK